MKKLVFYVIIFASICLLFTKCTVSLKEIDQKAIKSCSVCIDFLSDKKIYEATYRAYDRSNFQGDIIPLTEKLDSVKTLYKATFINDSEVQYIAAHTFCFVGMKKSEVESRFGKSLGKSSGPNFNSKKNSDEWTTWYRFKVGSLDKNGKMYVDSGGGFIFDYEFINGDTLYRASIDDVSRLKKCLDADGVRYVE